MSTYTPQARDLARELSDAQRLLRDAQQLRPILLKQLGYVPEPVLEFCNRARAAIQKKTTKATT